MAIGGHLEPTKDLKFGSKDPNWIGLSGLELIYKTGLDLFVRTFQERNERCQMMFGLDHAAVLKAMARDQPLSCTSLHIFHHQKAKHKFDLQEVSARLYEESALTAANCGDGGTLRSCLGD